MKKTIISIALLCFSLASFAQDAFDFDVQLSPVAIPNLPGLHSYAFAQHNGQWLIIGGRKDGVHARQPFASFAAASNNTDLYVIDPTQATFWRASVSTLPEGLREQLQATNINFYQDADTLYLIGGYAFSASANTHKTFTGLISVQVSALMEAVKTQANLQPYFKQINNDVFAVTGGQLGKIGHTYYLVGGQRFDGRYNPMGPDHGPGFSQQYTNQIRKFRLHNDGTQLSFSQYEAITDPVHLRRRDYNLLPQIFPDGQHGYTISSGVFQLQADLPFLYPVDITESGYTPVTGFNQYLSNYHSARAALYDSTANRMHALFFGGISRYYYQNDQLIEDDQVPFVRTISLLSRSADGTLAEYKLPVEMPGLKGAGAEFILNHTLPHYESEIVQLSAIAADTILIGHIYGGILSPALNPFSSNQTGITSADASVYSVRLIRKNSTAVQPLKGRHSFDFEVFPNPAQENITVRYELPYAGKVNYFLYTMDGKILQRGEWDRQTSGRNEQSLFVHRSLSAQPLLLALAFDDQFYAVKKIVRE
ncbi:MAG: T9SS C-terminal target domain-containing protein [Saprospiraceae bacterium]|nr:T9SS C-terminal target domain-containing protein [Saprospiraceae bacterium]